MEYSTQHRDSSLPSRSPSLSSLSDAASSAQTPHTPVSDLFEGDSVQDGLDMAGDNKEYILVVGGVGYIGSHTTLELLKADYNVIVVDDLSNSYQSVLDRVRHLATEYCQSQGKATPTLRFHKMDYRSAAMSSLLARYSSIKSTSGSPASQSTIATPVSRITGVIHFAAFKSVEESIKMPLPYYMNNVCGLVDFLNKMQQFGIKNFVFSSSATVYGSMANSGIPLQEDHLVHHFETFIDEDGKETTRVPGSLGLTSPYGRSKYMCEAILADVAKSDPSWKITALRYFNPVGCHESGLLGEDPRQKPSNLIPVIATVLTGERPKLSVFGTDWDTPDGTAVRDFIHVQDLACGHIAALAAAASDKVPEPFRAYNLGTGHGHTVKEVHESLEKASGQEIPVQEVGRRDGDVGFCVADNKRAVRELGWTTEKSLDDCAVDVWNFTKPRCQPKPLAKMDSGMEMS